MPSPGEVSGECWAFARTGIGRLPAANANQKQTHGEADVFLDLAVIQLISGHDDACRAAHDEAQKGGRCALWFSHVDLSLRCVTREQIAEKADSGSSAFFEG